jgi:hypothetical protein
MKQNITLSLDSHLLKQAKVFAAKRGVSISRLLAEDLEAIMAQQTLYARAKKEALHLLQHKLKLGGKGLPGRDTLHDRTLLR